MNKYLQQMKWFREIAMIADDVRYGSRHPQIDNEHLFLALVVVGGPVTDAFAAAGISIESTRDAFKRIHARRLASIGVRDSPAVDKPPRMPRGAFVFRDGVRPMLERAARQPTPDLALFDALLAEPSGHIQEVFAELAVDPATLRASIRAGDPEPDPDAPGTYRRFVAVPPAQAWALVSDPQRWDEWHPELLDGEVSTLTPAGVVRVEQRLPADPTPRQRANARRSKREYVIIRREPHRLVEWGCRYPEAPPTQVRSFALRVTISPTGTGSTIQLTYLRGQGLPTRNILVKLVGLFFRGLFGSLAVRLHLRRTADDISRALRR